jgi:epsilon-lactone hydrolase
VNETPVDDPSSNSIAIHPLDSQDAKIIDAMRALTRSSKGMPRGIEARGPFDAVMGSVSPRENVTFEAGPVGGIPGVRVLPSDWRPDEAVLHLQADGSTSAPPWPIAILWDMSQRGPKRGRSSPTIG